jgi:hypothetical protein
MVPSAFVMLDALPLNANGKVDRKALPAPDQARPELDAAFVEPRTATEKVLAGIWSQVLCCDRVGVHDNFFELGGHSLLATQLMSRVREIFQMDLPLRYIFETPTVARLAEKMRQDAAEPDMLEQIAEVFVELENLSEEEAAAMLDAERRDG